MNGNEGADIGGGGPGNDQVAGQTGNDAVDGGAGDDELELGAADVAPGVGAGADDLRGGDGVDRLSYNDHAAAITLTLDGQPGDGSAGEGDNIHDDVETVIGTTQDDVLIGDDLGQDLRGSRAIRSLFGRGLLVEVTCPAACRIRGRLILRKTVVASARRTRISGAVTRFRLKANRAGRRKLKRRSKVLMTLVVDVTDSAGQTTTLDRRITFRKPAAKAKKKA